MDTHPWNPDLHHANEWPYDEPLHIDAEYYGPPGDFWLRGEYLLWDLKGDRLPALVTTGPAASGGIPGQQGVETLFGGSRLDLDAFSGGRFTVGMWWESSYTCGFEGDYFFLGQRSGKFTAVSSGNPLLARPFLNVLTGKPDAVLIASPGVASGAIFVSAPTELQGAEATFVYNVGRGPHFSADLLASFCYLELGGDLNLVTSSAADGTQTTTLDQFTVHNHFYGGQLGGRLEYRWKSLRVMLTEKIALGARTADIDIEGSTSQITGGTVTKTASGLLAQPSNSGQHSDDTFAVVTETGIQAGWQMTDNVQLFAGYSFLYVSSVVRPGEIVDLGVNLNPGGARPAFVHRETNFWAHGLNAGLEVRY
jgi:hypothetical protein